MVKRSPLRILENAELRFIQPGYAETGEDGWGNPAVVLNDVEPFTVKAFLRPPDRGAKLQQIANAGIDIGTEYLEGYAIEPFTLPAWIQPNTVCDATIDGRTGKFEYLPATRSARTQVEAAAGSMIQGFFRQQVQ